eukprot:647053-Pleurochrysis_carterae.AAC.1
MAALVVVMAAICSRSCATADCLIQPLVSKRRQWSCRCACATPNLRQTSRKMAVSAATRRLRKRPPSASATYQPTQETPYSWISTFQREYV